MAVRQPALIMIQGPEPGSYYKLPDNRVTTIGRSSRNAVRVVAPTVSRFHCEITCVNGEWVLSDLNSKKGTIVNGEHVPDRTVLKAGDTVRLSSVVFRFEMMDETADRDDALVAIQEASLEHKLRTRGRATGSLEAIRARTRMTARSAPPDESSRPRRLRLNVLFVAAVAGVVLVLAAGSLAAAARFSGAAPRSERARNLYERGEAALAAGDIAGGLEFLARVQADYPHADAAERARQRAAEVAWELLQETFARIARLEAEGEYAAALEAYDEVDHAAMPPRASELARQRRDYTLRLAHAAFRTVRRRAESLVQQGERGAAEDILVRARESVGIPELAARVEAQISRIREEN